MSSFDPAEALERQKQHDLKTRGIVAASDGMEMPKNGARIRMALKSMPPLSPVIRGATGPLKLIVRLWAETDNHCVYCDKSPCSAEWSRDHILPKSMGGPGVIGNYLPACRRCNSNRALKTPVFPLAAPRWREYVKTKETSVVRWLWPESMRQHAKIVAWQEALG